MHIDSPKVMWGSPLVGLVALPYHSAPDAGCRRKPSSQLWWSTWTPARGGF